MNLSNRYRLTTAKPDNGITRTEPSTASDGRNEPSQGKALNSSFQAASIYGGVVAGMQPPLPQQEIPNPRASFPEASKGATPKAARELSGWSDSLQNVLDQPPASFPSGLILGGMAFCMAFGAWAWLGQIEEVGHARGQLIPKGEVYKIHPVESGKIAKVTVKEGQLVKAGQVLAELDAELAAGEVERLEQLLGASEIELSQKQTLLEKARLEVSSRDAIAASQVRAAKAAIAAANEKAATAKQLLGQQQASLAAYRARKQRLEPLAAETETLLSQLQATAEAAKNRVERLEPVGAQSQQLLKQLQANLDAAKERVQRLKPLVQEGAISREHLFQAEQAERDAQAAITQTQLQEATTTKQQLFQAEQSARDAQTAITQTQLQQATSVKEQLFQAEVAIAEATRSIAQTEGEIEQVNAEIEQLQAGLAQKQAEARRTQLEAQQQIQQLEVDLTQLKSKIAETQNLIQTAKTKLQERFIYAPVAGTISSLSVRNPGEVVQPGQTIAEMAPQNAPLILSASLPDREAGLVKPGMPVNVKLDAYPYQDYGVVSGTVTSISPDAKPDPKLGAIYKVEVKLDRDRLAHNRQTILFKAGQTATADIVIRRRRIADIFLDPIKKLQKGGIDL